MKLDEFLELTGMPLSKLAQKVGVTTNTIRNILEGERDLRLSVALLIEEATILSDANNSKPLVTVKELLPSKFLNKNASYKRSN